MRLLTLFHVIRGIIKIKQYNRIITNHKSATRVNKSLLASAAVLIQSQVQCRTTAPAHYNPSQTQ